MPEPRLFGMNVVQVIVLVLCGAVCVTFAVGVVAEVLISLINRRHYK